MTFCLAYLLILYLACSLAFYMAMSPAVGVRLRSCEAHGDRGPARPTAIKSWQMRSGEAPCDQELAAEVRRCPLRSKTGRGGPARRRKEGRKEGREE